MAKETNQKNESTKDNKGKGGRFFRTKGKNKDFYIDIMVDSYVKSQIEIEVCKLLGYIDDKQLSKLAEISKSHIMKQANEIYEYITSKPKEVEKCTEIENFKASFRDKAKKENNKKEEGEEDK